MLMMETISGSELGKWVLLSIVTWTSCLQLFKSLALFFLLTLFSSLVYNKYSFKNPEMLTLPFSCRKACWESDY